MVKNCLISSNLRFQWMYISQYAYWNWNSLQMNVAKKWCISWHQKFFELAIDNCFSPDKPYGAFQFQRVNNWWCLLIFPKNEQFIMKKQSCSKPSSFYSDMRFAPYLSFPNSTPPWVLPQSIALRKWPPLKLRKPGDSHGWKTRFSSASFSFSLSSRKCFSWSQTC